ncbi:DUF4190 domain-containing protein [Mycolicibacterium wolinskyi]|uniref:DUF4190 domain-containing protein n=1 Tax=Mycolicibacterium wolinskyi TaxID=59750 RepID=UPI0009FC034D|nr:DUF4190 domain-containing protein [Mycolicibacterium wolinskyi]
MDTDGQPPARFDRSDGTTSRLPVDPTRQADARTNSIAIAALVFGLILPPLAVPLGHVARAQIRRTGERGSGMALAGLILGYYSLAGLVILVIAALLGVDLL